MRALVKHAGGVGIEEVAEPELEPGHVLVDVAHAAVCGTDRAALDGGHDVGSGTRTLGHEASGRIVAIAPGGVRDDLRVGDRVTFETDAYLCMRCDACRTEQYNRCPNRRGIGTTADGALADRIAMPERAIHVLPDSVSLVEAALTEPLAIAVHAVVEQSPSLVGEVVVVIGPGAIGQLCARVARAVGATVVLVGRSRHAASLAKARNAGIDVVVDAETEDLEAIVHGLTGGRGAHSVFECSGATSVAESSLPLLRRGGRLVLVAFFQTAPAFDVDRLIHHELEIVGSRGKRPSSYRTALALMASGAVRVEPLISARLPLESWSDGLDRVARGEKVVFDVAP